MKKIRKYLACWKLAVVLVNEFDENTLDSLKFEELKAIYDSKAKVNDQGETQGKSKDPSDYKLDALSTDWQAENHYCTKCLQTTSHNEYMADICNGCGSFGTQKRYQRTWRKIFIDGKWRYQVRYIDGKEEIRDQWY